MSTAGGEKQFLLFCAGRERQESKQTGRRHIRMEGYWRPSRIKSRRCFFSPVEWNYPQESRWLGGQIRVGLKKISVPLPHGQSRFL
jgi:hypothetical protein